MSGRPSDGMDLDELRDEFDWMFEFQSLMAERIRGDADVHNLVDYVGKLEDENAKLREELEAAKHDLSLFSSVLVASKFENAKLRKENDRLIEAIEELHSVSLEDRLVQLENDNAKLRELCEYLWEFAKTCGADHPFLHELGVEVDV